MADLRGDKIDRAAMHLWVVASGTKVPARSALRRWKAVRDDASCAKYLETARIILNEDYPPEYYHEN